MVWLLCISFTILYYLLCTEVKFFSFDGRISRVNYWKVYFFLYSLLMVPYIWLLFSILSSVVQEDIASQITLLGFIFYRALRIPIDVRRCHDINFSGWHSIMLFIPLINLIFLLGNFTRKGTDGKNKYGENPLLEREDVPEHFQ